MSVEEKLMKEAKESLEKFNEAKDDLIATIKAIRDNAIERLEKIPEDYDFPEGGEDLDELDRVAKEANRVFDDLNEFYLNLEDLVAEKFPYEKEEK
jgi:hypothetical protein